MKKPVTCQPCENLRDAVVRAEYKVRNVLALLSAIAVALVFTNEFVKSGSSIPLLSVSWDQFQGWMRIGIWLAFVAYVVVYGVVTRNKVEYVRKHVLEIVICVAWFPHYQAGLFHHLTSLFSVNTLQVAGTLAHAWRVARWTIRRFSSHPLIVTGSAALALVSTASVVLNQVEPQTFPTVWDADWYCMSTITTIGYGDLVPKTGLGRAVGVVIMLGGIGVAGVFLGLISGFVRSRLFGRGPGDMYGGAGPIFRGGQGSADDRELQKQILEELKTNNRLLTELLAGRRQDSGKDSSLQPPESSPPPPA